MLLIGVMTGTSQAAIVTYHNDLPGFLAATSTSLIDFEGIADSEKFVESNFNPFVIDGVTFSSPLIGVYADALIIADENAKNAIGAYINGAPFKSDMIIGNYYDYGIDVTLPDGITAVGGFFGKVYTGTDYPHNPLITIGLADGPDEVFDSAAYSIQDMGLLGPTPNFFGWVVSGDTITSISHQLSNASEFEWAGIDNFRYGVEDTSPPIIPEPASCIVWSLIGLSCIGAGWWRRRKAA